MKAWIFSDLHVDVGADAAPFELPDPRPEHDLVIIAGDICEHTQRGVRWIADNGLNTVPVFYVPGNHEFYRNTVDRGLEKGLEEAARHNNIHILSDAHFDLWGVRIIGATLWTDYLLFGEAQRWAAIYAAKAEMNDHKKVRIAQDGYRRWSTLDAAKAHEASRTYLSNKLAETFDGTRVVVTHHAPSIKSVPDDRWSDVLSAAYASDVEDLVDKSDLWIHGHLHPNRCDYQLGNGRVISNPRGYAYRGEDRCFDPGLVMDLGSLRAMEAAE